MKKDKQLNKPYCNNIRPFKCNSGSHYYSNSSLSYVGEDAYSPGRGGMHFVRAFNILQQEMLKIFEFVEPSDENLKCYSLQIHSLIIKTCIELEANFRTILRNNGYTKNKENTENTEKYWKIYDYVKLEDSHKLSHYKVHLPHNTSDSFTLVSVSILRTVLRKNCTVVTKFVKSTKY